MRAHAAWRCYHRWRAGGVNCGPLMIVGPDVCDYAAGQVQGVCGLSVRAEGGGGVAPAPRFLGEVVVDGMDWETTFLVLVFVILAAVWVRFGG